MEIDSLIKRIYNKLDKVVCHYICSIYFNINKNFTFVSNKIDKEKIEYGRCIKRYKIYNEKI